MADQTPNIPQDVLVGNSNTSAAARPGSSSSNQNPYASLATMMSPSQQNQQQSYQAYTHISPQSGWPMYPSSAPGAPAAAHYPQYTYIPYQGHYYPMPIQPVVAIPATGNPTNILASDSGTTEVNAGREARLFRSPSPPPPQYEHWDEALWEFLREARLIQALKGLECDMLVLNSEWECTGVSLALEKLIKSLSVRQYLVEWIYHTNGHIS